MRAHIVLPTRPHGRPAITRSGYPLAVDYFRQAAIGGHAEGAFRLAAALRTGLSSHLPKPAEAEVWYRWAAQKGFGPAAAWLARAYQEGDGVPADEEQARRWALMAEGLRPHQPLSRSLCRQDAAPEDPLASLCEAIASRLERGAARGVAHRAGRWVLGLLATALAALAVVTVGYCFWVGSSSFHHIPLFMLLPSLLHFGLASLAAAARRSPPGPGPASGGGRARRSRGLLPAGTPVLAGRTPPAQGRY